MLFTVPLLILHSGKAKKLSKNRIPAQLMKQQHIRHIIRLLFKRLSRYAGQIKKAGGRQAVHLFRVETKKLRAFLRLLSLELKKEDELNIPGSLKKMYRALGKMRDRQLHQRRMKAAIKSNKHIHPAIKLIWKEEVKKICGKEMKLLSVSDMVAAGKKLEGKLPGMLEADTVKKFFRLKMNGILHIVNKGSYTDEELHSIRKHLKDIIYIRKLYDSEKKIQQPFTLWKMFELKTFEQTAQQLGTFNDLCNDLHFLKSVMKKRNSKEKGEMQHVQKIWLAEKRELKRTIVDSLARPKLFKIKNTV